MSRTPSGIVSVTGTGDVGSCCACDLLDGDGKLVRHIPQHTLYLCQNPDCGHFVCLEHLQSCGFCRGCCAKEHGLDSHRKGD